MLYEAARHETLNPLPWDEERARAAIDWIVRDTERVFSPDRYWPMHPRDRDGDDRSPAYPLYHGAVGVLWALHYLDAVGAARMEGSYREVVPGLIPKTGSWLEANGLTERASYMMGETSIRMLSYAQDPSEETATILEELIRSNIANPAREVMWGAPGTLMAALLLYEHTGESRWKELFQETEARLWSELLWSSEHACHYWTQDLYGQTSTYIDAVHGFVGTAQPIIRGRHLLDEGRWGPWRERIAQTIRQTVTREGNQANWRAWLSIPENFQGPRLMQYCHGAPGFVVCLADYPGADLDDLLLAGGEAIWAAGPLAKGSNLCHGTGGNGYAFLKLNERTGDSKWLDRARAFAMHGIMQTERDALAHHQLRYSLWTGDPGFAIYLWDCIRGQSAFPTVDVFFPKRA
jgi:hypothetical protein